MEAAGSRKKILLVEDEESVRREMRELLEEEGYVVVEASNGKEAIAALRQGGPPALVLLDLLMPVMDGKAVLQQMAREHYSVPVVVTTAAETYDIPRDIPRVYKPYTLEPLLNLVQTRCHRLDER